MFGPALSDYGKLLIPLFVIQLNCDTRNNIYLIWSQNLLLFQSNFIIYEQMVAINESKLIQQKINEGGWGRNYNGNTIN